ncbi:MAG: HD domain-containing protein [Anaerolineales bacterium]|nr:HD domain-containing protein [Anaerolineales bacterium]
MVTQEDNHDLPGNDNLYYTGRWVACIGNKVIGQGGTPQQALRAAKATRFKETPEISYVPTAQPLVLHPIINKILDILPKGLECYLVGGAVRDSIIGAPVNDLDFVMPAESLEVARRTADFFGGAFYPLDASRQIGRVIIRKGNGTRLLLDFSMFQGQTLESDLIARDFTINSMAVNLRHPQQLLDPLGGYRDLQEKKLQACTPNSFINDPVRIVRAVRFAAAHDLHVLPETRKLMHASISLLPQVSVERLRDELFQILAGRQVEKSIHALEILGVIQFILPELTQLKGVHQSLPHTTDVWEHTLKVVNNLESILSLFSPIIDSEEAIDETLILVEESLGRYREQIQSHLDTRFVIDRSLKPLLFFAALFHDVGKPDCLQVDNQGRKRFINHEQLGAQIVFNRAKALHLSNTETNRVMSIVRNHLRPLYLALTGKPLSRRAIYRYFRDCGQSGVDICLLSLADILGTFGSNLSLDKWKIHLEVTRRLLMAYWEDSIERLNPPSLINGHDLIKKFGLKPGPKIGEILESVREAQATGQITSPQEAMRLAQSLLNKNNSE